MRAVVQRVSRAAVTVDGEVTGAIGRGLLVLLGVAAGDTQADLEWLVNRIVGLRVFEDEDGRMNVSLTESGGEMLVVSQFTLLGDCRKGRRPSFVHAARPEDANAMYEQFCELARAAGVTVQTGRFQQHMDVELVNDGPVTLMLDSTKLF